MCNGISVFWIIVIISGNLVGIVESFWHIVVGELFKDIELKDLAEAFLESPNVSFTSHNPTLNI